jgi:multidrug resistance protein MdtO
MDRAVSSAWWAIVRQAWSDLQPFPGRFGMAWRIALLCALFAGVAMIYKIPESAIGCYLIIFLARPNGAECVGQALGLIILASVVVLAMASLVEATADSAFLRILLMAAFSFIFVFLGAASQLGEIGSIIALVIAFILSLVDQVPAGEVVTRGLLYAWQMACVPMAMMIVFNLIFGTSPHRLLRETVTERLSAAATALEQPGPAGTAALRAPLAEGNAEVGKRGMLATIFHTAPGGTVTWLCGAAMNSYRLMLAVAALPADAASDVRADIARRCRAAAAAITTGNRPTGRTDAAPTGQPTLDTIGKMLDDLALPNGGSDAKPVNPPFLARDAFTNPDYQRYALKTTAAAISCYLIYSLINWQGIHTAMITCYVAALGTTAETVHKLALRIAGCLIGAAIGFLSILFVIPHLESVGGLMALVFCAILVAAWVSTGSERISYAGVQIGLAFLLTVLNGFSPSLSMESGRDRIIGILLGNVVVYLFFTGIWSKSAVTEARERLTRAFEAMARLAGLDQPARSVALAEADIVETEMEAAYQQLALLPFEPSSRRPSDARIADAERLTDETRALLPVLMFSAEGTEGVAERLSHLARRIGVSEHEPEPTTMPPPDGSPSGEIAIRLERIGSLTEELAA